ncbi:MAG: HNH endonuclease [Candidatus Eisenbacteria bacterium]
MIYSSIRRYIRDLPPQHQNALAWFDDHAGQLVGWPGQLGDGTLLAGKAKGIYKPKWSTYALSVRQSLTGPYPDREIVHRPDGSWVFEYFQEGLDIHAMEASFTNQGLIECMKGIVPVGVFVQVKEKPKPMYKVLGLAIVTGYDVGYFYLEGFGAAAVRETDDSTLAAPGLAPERRADEIATMFDPALAEDERKKTLRQVSDRRGQAGFRSTLLDAYGARCAISGYEATEALEAAHIVPYRGLTTNHPSNGLLLRADLHTLFDLGLLAIDESLGTVLLDADLRSTQYGMYVDTRLSDPRDARLQPSRKALAIHREFARSRGRF